jgi:hypothetical protein
MTSEMIWELYLLIFSNGKIYIGIARDSDKRLRNHYMAATRYGSQMLVHRAIRKYGAPVMERLAIGRQSYINDLEIAAIESFRSRDPKVGYNVALGGMIPPSVLPEVAAKIGAAATRNWADPVIAAKYVSAMTESANRPEVTAKVSAAKQAQWDDPVKREEFLRIGRERGWRTPAAAVKRAASLKGIRPSMLALKLAAAANRTPEFRAAQSDRMRAYYAANPHKTVAGQKRTPEQCARISAAKKGKPAHPTSLKALAEGRKKRWAEPIIPDTL